jgi:starvation-inducible DNA-binding protein
MWKKTAGHNGGITAQPHFNQRAAEIQKYGTVNHALPLELEEPVRLEMTEHLNQLLADTMTLRDLYKKSHWQVAGPTFYQLHLLFDKHYDEQLELVDTIAERIQLLGGVSLAMAPDIAETTRIERPPRGREEVPVQLSRLLDAHKIIIGECRELAERADKLGDDGTNDLAVSDVLRTHELQVWFLSEHLVQIHRNQKDRGCLSVSPHLYPPVFDRTLPSRFPVPTSAIGALYLALRGDS